MPGGRPTKMTEDTVKNLKQYFAKGYSDSEACKMAEITKKTLYNYCDNNPSFYTTKERLKRTPSLRAREVVLNSIENGDVNTSKWYLERKCKEEFSLRTESTGKDGADLIPAPIVIVDSILEDETTIESNDQGEQQDED